MTVKRRWTSSLSSTAEGSSMMIRRASCDSARAMLTICWEAADSEPTPPRRRHSGREGRVDARPRRGGRRQRADLRAGPDLRVAEPGEQVGGPPVDLAGPDEAELRLLPAEEHVVGDGGARGEVGR